MNAELMPKILFGIILVSVITLYISQRLSVITTALISISSLSLFRLLDLEQALAGFSSPATISIGAMFILSAGLIKTGALEPLTAWLARYSGGSYTRLMIAMALTIPLASAFTNNTPVVVMMVPVLMGLGRELEIAPSKLLMPLSFMAILGGTCTMIGTSTNLLVDDIYSREGHHLGIFDFTPLGLIVLAVGILFLILMGQRLLPIRDSLTSMMPNKRRSSYVTEVIVQADSPLIGKVVDDTFPRKGKLRFLQLMRSGDIQLTANARSMTISECDALILEGSPEALNDLLIAQQVELGTVIEDALRVPMRTFSRTLFELVVLPDSPLVGNMVGQLKLNTTYGVKVLAIQRGGLHHRMDIRGMRIKSGDMFLVQGDDQSLRALTENPDFLVIREVDKTIPRRDKAAVALSVVLGVVLLTAVTPIPLVIWAMLGVVLLITTRCMGTDDCIAALDFNVLFLLIGTIPLGAAFKNTGLTEDVSTLLLHVAGPEQPILLIGTLYLATNVLTSLLSNTAVAALMTPLAIQLAITLQIDAKPLIMTVAFAASAAFATPIAYQTNLIVMGPAGYTFKDFLRFGIPLSLLIWVVASIAIPFIWPLT